MRQAPHVWRLRSRHAGVRCARGVDDARRNQGDAGAAADHRSVKSITFGTRLCGGRTAGRWRIPILPRRRNRWVTDTLQWRRTPGSLSPRTSGGFSSLPFVARCLLNQLLPPVNAPPDRADPGKMSATGVIQPGGWPCTFRYTHFTTACRKPATAPAILAECVFAVS